VSARGGAKTAASSRARPVQSAAAACVGGARAQEAARGAAPPGKGGGAAATARHRLVLLRGHGHTAGDAQAKSRGTLETRPSTPGPLTANPSEPAATRAAAEGGQGRQAYRGPQKQSARRGALATGAGKQAQAAA